MVYILLLDSSAWKFINILFSNDYEKRKALGCGLPKFLLISFVPMTESTPSSSGPLAGKTIALGVSGSIILYKVLRPDQ